MNNSNLPQLYKEGIFNKIISFFKKIFHKNNEVIEKIEVKTTEVDNTREIESIKSTTISNAPTNYIEDMRKASNLLKLKEEILELVLKNPQVVYNLSSEKLIELDNVCEDEIKKKKKELEELKLKNERLQQKLQAQLAQ